MMKGMGRAAGVLCALALSTGLCATAAFAQGQAMELAFDDAGGEQIASGAKLFDAVDNGMPGDTFAGTLSIKNDGEGPCEFFTTARDVAAKGPDDTLERIGFTVAEGDDAVLFDGTLKEAEGAEPMSLGTAAPGESKEVGYEVRIPTELTSEYADAMVGLNVGITAVSRQEALAPAPGPAVSQPTEETKLGKTGDGAFRAMAVAGAVGIAAALALRRRKKRC